MSSFVKRALVLVAGLFILGAGVGFSVAAGLGVSPVSCLPYVLSRKLPVSLGTLTILMHSLLLAAQIVILKKEFRPIQLFQLAVTFVFGFFTDLGVMMTSVFRTGDYLGQWLLCLVSCPVIALGVALEVKAGLIVLPMEGLLSVLARKTGKEFGQVKVVFDTTLVALAVLLSLVFFGELRGVREGTLFSAVAVGSIIRWINPRLRFLDGWFARGKEQV